LGADNLPNLLTNWPGSPENGRKVAEEGPETTCDAQSAMDTETPEKLRAAKYWKERRLRQGVTVNNWGGKSGQE
jgi:hypothetical protein